MFKRKKNKHLPAHILVFRYYRDKQVKQMPEKDKRSIDKFYEKHLIRYKDLTSYQQVIVFKRTVNFIWIIAHYFDIKKGAKFVNPMQGKEQGFGVVRTQSYIFYKDGRLLYELDHDYQEYKYTHTTQVEDKKLVKRNYDLHEELNNELLIKIGECGQSLSAFDKACHDLLRNDNPLLSIDFIKK